MTNTETQDLVVLESPGDLQIAAPKLIADAGAAAAFAWEEFFIARIAEGDGIFLPVAIATTANGDGNNSTANCEKVVALKQGKSSFHESHVIRRESRAAEFPSRSIESISTQLASALPCRAAGGQNPIDEMVAQRPRSMPKGLNCQCVRKSGDLMLPRHRISLV